VQSRSKWSLRGLLYLLTASVVLPGAALLAYSVYSQYKQDEQAAASEAYNLARLTADNVQAFLSDARQVLAVLANRPAMQQPGCDPVFRDFKDLYPQFANLSLSRPDGYLVCSSTIQPGSGTTFVGDTPWFQQAYSQQGFIVGPIYRGPVTGRLVSVLAQPVVGPSGKMVGALQAPIDLLKFRLVPAADKLPNSTVIAIFDTRGNVVARSQEPEKYVGVNVRGTPIIDILLARKQGTARSISSQNVERIYGFLPIPGTDWLVLAGISTDVALAGARQAAIRNVLSGSALLIAVLLFAIYLSKRISRPMLAMQDAARKVAAGDLDERAPVAGPLEIAEVATQFNTMLDAIRDSQSSLANAQSNLLLLGTCVEHLNDMVLILDARQLDQGWPSITFVNHTFEEITGYSRAEVIGRSTQILYGPQTAQAARDLIAIAWRAVKPVRTELINYTKAGQAIWVEVDLVPIKDAGGELLYWVSIERNVTQRKQAEVALRSSEERLKRALEGSRLALWDVDLTSGKVYLSETWSELLGGPPVPTTTTITELSRNVPKEDQALIRQAMVGTLKGQSDSYTVEHRLITDTGETIWIVSHGRITERDPSGRATRVVGINRDITERKSREAEINQLAYYDVLTGLPNRRLLMNRLAQSLAGAKRTLLTGALLFVDLDRFKSVNDARGHAVGDTLLRRVAERLSGLLREGDTVARMGGDEFVLLLPDLADGLDLGARSAMAIAEKVRAALERPFHIDGQSFSSGASIGVTLMPKEEQTADDLLREADTAMYRAKASGRNQIAFFEASMQSEVEERMAFEHDLSQAIDAQQMTLHLQPQVDPAGHAVGAELLMRWNHPVRGQIPPSLFIPVAEETGMILRLGDWTLREGCKMLMRLMDAGQPLPLSINVSPRQFRQPDFVQRVKTVLRETGAPASWLIFEVTEGLLIDHLDESIERMHELAALGIRFSIDDFGTGYSSLAYLKRLPLYELKIDKSFVQDTPNDTDDSEIVQMVISMAKHLRLRVVAEGVETRAQADFLNASGCDSMQGYLFARPMPIEAWLTR
jgi:diguanylate cyclase (GGDEF)-like protein/PAS domain S-box-containing protein